MELRAQYIWVLRGLSLVTGKRQSYLLKSADLEDLQVQTNRAFYNWLASR